MQMQPDLTHVTTCYDIQPPIHRNDHQRPPAHLPCACPSLPAYPPLLLCFLFSFVRQVMDGSGHAGDLAGSLSSRSRMVEACVGLLHSHDPIKRLCGIGILRYPWRWSYFSLCLRRAAMYGMAPRRGPLA